jgi:Fe2+ or Zn2+ uptake regulation protein
LKHWVKFLSNIFDNLRASHALLWAELREQHPQLTPIQTKAINKLYDVGPDGFANGISTEKCVNLCRVSRATAYRELTALCEMGVLVQTGVGRGTRYQMVSQRSSNGPT